MTCFVFILLCLAADFWVVKNVTGRFLVGLRWRNNVDPSTGESNWVYESRTPGKFIVGVNFSKFLFFRLEGFKRKPVLPKEFRVFWGGLIICPFFWFLFSVSCLFTFKVIQKKYLKNFEQKIYFSVCLAGSLSDRFGF